MRGIHRLSTEQANFQALRAVFVIPEQWGTHERHLSTQLVRASCNGIQTKESCSSLRRQHEGSGFSSLRADPGEAWTVVFRVRSFLSDDE